VRISCRGFAGARASGLAEIVNGALRVAWAMGDGSRLRLDSELPARSLRSFADDKGDIVWQSGVRAGPGAELTLDPGGVHVLLQHGLRSPNAARSSARAQLPESRPSYRDVWGSSTRFRKQACARCSRTSATARTNGSAPRPPEVAAAVLPARRVEGGARIWGPAVQLYALRSAAQLGHRRLRRPAAAGRSNGRSAARA
jgi:hypothetical protein